MVGMVLHPYGVGVLVPLLVRRCNTRHPSQQVVPVPYLVAVYVRCLHGLPEMVVIDSERAVSQRALHRHRIETDQGVVGVHIPHTLARRVSGKGDADNVAVDVAGKVVPGVAGAVGVVPDEREKMPERIVQPCPALEQVASEVENGDAVGKGDEVSARRRPVAYVCPEILVGSGGVSEPHVPRHVAARVVVALNGGGHTGHGLAFVEVVYLGLAHLVQHCGAVAVHDAVGMVQVGHKNLIEILHEGPAVVAAHAVAQLVAPAAEHPVLIILDGDAVKRVSSSSVVLPCRHRPVSVVHPLRAVVVRIPV